VANPEKAFTVDLPVLEGSMLGAHGTSKTKSEPWNIKQEENVKTAVTKLPLLERIAVPKRPPHGSGSSGTPRYLLFCLSPYPVRSTWVPGSWEFGHVAMEISMRSPTLLDFTSDLS
jgi:hypothetical protein